MSIPVYRLSFRAQLIFLGTNEVVINEVLLNNGTSLFGVTVQSVAGDFVVFNQTGSAGAGSLIVRIEQIASINAEPVFTTQ